MVRGRGENSPRGGKGLTLTVHAPVGEQEARDEDEHDRGAADAGDEDDRVRPLALLLDLLAGE